MPFLYHGHYDGRPVGHCLRQLATISANSIHGVEEGGETDDEGKGEFGEEEEVPGGSREDVEHRFQEVGRVFEAEEDEEDRGVEGLEVGPCSS